MLDDTCCIPENSETKRKKFSAQYLCLKIKDYT